MNKWTHAKSDYQQIPIPEELADRVQAGIRQGKAAHRRAVGVRRAWRSVGAVAACFALLLGGLNLSPTFAAAAADVPVLGGMFQVLTVRSYKTTQGQTNYQVSVPEIEADSTLADKVNAEIQERVDQHLAETKELFAQYKEAFLASGGTEEEWEQRQMDVIVDYEIRARPIPPYPLWWTCQGAFSAYDQQYYSNLDLENDRDITLEDLLGEDWVNICNQSIQAKIDASVDENGFTYFFPADQGGFTTVDESTSFYIRDDGVPVVVFPRYSIAAGAAGTVEFPIEK